jgi:hypothetical protein
MAPTQEYQYGRMAPLLTILNTNEILGRAVAVGILMCVPPSTAPGTNSSTTTQHRR